MRLGVGKGDPILVVALVHRIFSDGFYLRLDFVGRQVESTLEALDEIMHTSISFYCLDDPS